MSRALEGQADFLLPAPIDGLNLIGVPGLPPELGGFKTTHARQLDNYYVYDWGIRERGPGTAVDLTNAGYPWSMISFTSASNQGTIISASSTHLYRYLVDGTLSTLGTPGTIYGPFAFSGYLFFPDGAGACARYALSSDTYAATSFTFGGGSTPHAGFGYRDRAYFFTGTNAVVDYGAVGQVTGASAAQVDFASVFRRGRKILFGTSWSYNQGDVNTELFVIGNEAGEILIYSGGYPAGADWQLVSRLEIPIPLSRFISGPLIGSIYALGQDITINTALGLISLREVFTGSREQATYFTKSRNLGPILSGSGGDVSLIRPFAYFAGATHVYVLNYERGAWSRFPDITSGSDLITCIACSTAPASHFTSTTSSYVLIGHTSASGTDGAMLRINESDLVSHASTTHAWKTPFFDFGRSIQKDVKSIRLYGRDMAGASFSHSAQVANGLSDSNVGAASSATKSVSSTAYTSIEMAPSGVGEELSFIFSKSGSGSTQNEISSAKIFYEQGGRL